MILDKYFKKIESLAFQIQFSVLSGIDVVQFALSRDATVKSLLASIYEDPNVAEGLCDRILYLLPKIANDKRLSYDESIVTYLHCLEKTDLLLAHRVSLSIWSTEGLLWSRWLAFKIIQLVQQIEQSLDVSSVSSISASSRIAEDIVFVDTRCPATTSAVTMAAKPDMIGSFAFEISTAA